MFSVDFRHISFSLPDFSIVNNFTNFIIFVLILLLFGSIIPCASEAVSAETTIFAAIFVLCGLFVFEKKQKNPAEIKSLLLPIFFLGAYSVLQGVATLFFHTGIFYSFDAYASLRSGLKIASTAGFIWLLAAIFQSKIKFLTLTLILTGNFFTVFGILRFLLQNYFPTVFPEFIFPQLLPDKGFGTFLNQNHFAYLMLMTLGFNVSFFRRANFKNFNWVIWLLLCLTTLAALILTGSRGGIISAFVEIAVLIMLPAVLKKDSRKSAAGLFQNIWKPLSIVGGIFVLFVSGVVLIGQERVLHRFGELPLQFEGATSWATFRRIDVWQAAVGIIRDDWFSGIGFGGFRIAVSQYINISGQLAPQQAHNDYLEFLTAGGMIGLALALWFLYEFFRLIRQRFSETNSDISDIVRLGAICGIIGVALHSLVDFGLQIEANLLFFAALIFLAIHKSDEPQETTSAALNSRSFLTKIVGAAAFLIAALYSLIFGFAVYQLQLAKVNLDAQLIEMPFLKFTYDADIYDIKSGIDESGGDYRKALENMRTAISLRPQDYELQLKIARIRQKLNEPQVAEEAFRRAIELAPNYARPYFDYGQFLISRERSVEGFNALRTAFRRNPKYFDSAAETAWIQTNKNPLKTIEILSPLVPVEKEYLAAFFFQKGEFAGFLNLTCHEKDVNEKMRAKIIQAFFEIREFHFADLINRRECNAEVFSSGDFEDGSFEIGNFSKKPGFGWRIGNLPPNIRIFLDAENFAAGRQSLGVNYDGDYENAAPLFSQTLVIEKRAKYLLTFSYKTEALKTVAFPVLQITAENSTKQDLLKTIELSPHEKDWNRVTTEIQTDGEHEALEIRLSRNRCGQDLCPIFGNLRLDDFRLEKK